MTRPRSDDICGNCGNRYGSHYPVSSQDERPECPVPIPGGGIKPSAIPGGQGYWKWNDHEEYPANRHGENCLNCGQRWEYHNGWFCDKPGGILRYKTQDMITTPKKKTSVVVPKPKDEQAELLAFFKAVRPGHCACDTPREKCQFHRDD